MAYRLLHCSMLAIADLTQPCLQHAWLRGHHLNDLRSFTQWPQRRRVQVVADAYDRPHQCCAALALLTSCMFCLNGFILVASDLKNVHTLKYASALCLLHTEEL